MIKTAKRKTGDWGEEEAVIFLEKKGYEIVERNYQVKSGEIDIVAWHNKPYYGRTLCFVEVKTRKQNDGSAERATKEKKMPPLFSAARYYCVERGINMDKVPMQFEQVSVYTEGNKPEFQHYVIIVE